MYFDRTDYIFIAVASVTGIAISIMGMHELYARIGLKPQEVGISDLDLLARLWPIPVAVAVIRSADSIWDYLDDQLEGFFSALVAVFIGFGLAVILLAPGDDSRTALGFATPDQTSWTPLVIQSECVTLQPTSDIVEALEDNDSNQGAEEEAGKTAETSTTGSINNGIQLETLPPPDKASPLLYLGRHEGIGVFYDARLATTIRLPLAQITIVETRQRPCR